MRKTFLGFIYYYFLPRKNIVFILSTMRSGSTMLKALLAEAPDVSNLPEIKGRSYKNHNRYTFYYKFSKLSKKRIIVAKTPRGFFEEPYPRTKLKHHKIIILFRDPCDNVLSLQKMNNKPHQKREDVKTLVIEDLGQYWYQTYELITNNKELMNHNEVVFVKYEDLLESPKVITRKLFAFMGSQQKTGVDCYHKPDTYQWEWGRDDASDKIKGLRITKRTDYGDVRRKETAEMTDQLPQIAAQMSVMCNSKKRITVNDAAQQQSGVNESVFLGPI